MLLRGTRVLARCNDDGSLVAPGGKVEIRYKPNDTRAYAASVGNLEPIASAALLPDADFPAAEPAPSRVSTVPGKKSAEKKAAIIRSGDLPSRPVPGGVLVYADGACSGNPGPAGIGVVALMDDVRFELSEFLGEGTNNIAELTAIQRAADLVPDPAMPVLIMTDSSYAIGVLSKGWKAKANIELIARVKKALARLSSWELGYVPGHAGVPLNERADTLAVNAVRERRNEGWKKVKP